MPPFGNYGMDTFVSQHMSELGPVDLPRIGGGPWLASFVMKRIFYNRFPERKAAAAAFIFLRRAEAAIDEWNLAREPLAEFNPENVSGYFKALRHLENSVADIYQGHDLAMKGLGAKLFQKGDGSSLFERLNRVYNDSKHVVPTEPGQLHTVWIANDGLRTKTGAVVSFVELAELLDGMSEIATGITTGVPPEMSTPAPT